MTDLGKVFVVFLGMVISGAGVYGICTMLNVPEVAKILYVLATEIFAAHYIAKRIG